MAKGKITGTTKSGFKFSISENVINDWRVIKAIKKTQSKDVESLNGIVDLVELILGNQEDALCNHVMREDGSVPATEIAQELTEIIEIAKDKSPNLGN